MRCTFAFVERHLLTAGRVQPVDRRAGPQPPPSNHGQQPSAGQPPQRPLDGADIAASSAGPGPLARSGLTRRVWRRGTAAAIPPRRPASPQVAQRHVEERIQVRKPPGRPLRFAPARRSRRRRRDRPCRHRRQHGAAVQQSVDSHASSFPAAAVRSQRSASFACSPSSARPAVEAVNCCCRPSNARATSDGAP